MTRGARGRSNVSGARGRDVVDGPRGREVLEGGRSRQVLLGPRSRNTGGLPAALRDAVLWLDSRYSVAGEPRVINQGTGGSALNAKYGSVLGAYVYDGAAVLPGIVGNYLSTPDAAALDITGDIELVARLRPTNGWSDGVQCKIINKFTSPGQTSYALSKKTTGALELLVSQDGTTAEYPFSSASIAGTSAQWVKATYRASDGRVQFFYAADQTIEPTSWTQLGADRSTTYSSLFASTAPVEIGARQSGVAEPAAASIYRTIVRDGIDGTTVLDVDLANVADYATSFTATTGQTVTVNSTSSDTNDPLLLTHTGENYVYQPITGSTVNGTVISVGEVATYTVDGDLDFYVHLQPDTWTPASQYSIWSCWSTTGGYEISLQTNGRPQFVGTGTVTAWAAKSATAAVPFTVGESGWIRVTRTLADGVVTFYTSTNGADWTQLGATATYAAGEALAVPAQFLGHSRATSQTALGKFFKAVVKNDGATIVDIDYATDITDAGATSFTATSGQTVTVNRATSGRKTALVTRPIWLFGTDDYLEVADNALLDFDTSDSLSVLAVVRRWATPASNARVVMKGPSTGYALTVGGTGASDAFYVTQGGLFPAATAAITAGTLATLTGMRDVSLDKVILYKNNTATETTDTTVATIANSDPLRVGAQSNAATNFLDMEVVAVAVFRRVLTTDEIAAICQYYGTI